MIKFLDLNQINLLYETEFAEEFNKFLSSGYYILGKEVNNFEKNFAVFAV